MKLILQSITDVLLALLPFLGKSRKKQTKEFTELIISQFEFLASQLEKALADYLSLSSRIKEMHAEVLELRIQLTDALALRCGQMDCLNRSDSHAQD